MITGVAKFKKGNTCQVPTHVHAITSVILHSMSYIAYIILKQ